MTPLRPTTLSGDDGSNVENNFPILQDVTVPQTLTSVEKSFDVVAQSGTNLTLLLAS